MIFVDLSTFFLALKTVFSRRWRSPRRILWTIISILSVTTVYGLNVVCRLLDEVLFPGYRSVTVRPPVIIVATPRSGTTYLHGLMACDRKNFACFKLYQTLLPSVTIYRIIDRIANLDHRIGGPIASLLRRMDRRLFGGWERIHPMGLAGPEEDEGLFLFTFATPAIYMLFPFFREVAALRFADRLPDWKRRAIGAYYRNSVKRFIYATGGDTRILLLKSVLFNSRMKIVMDAFPGARIVYLVRSPYEAIPSFVSMFTAFWKVHSPDIPRDSETAREWAELAMEYYRYFHDNRRHLDASNVIEVRYDDLIGDPIGTIGGIYSRFKMDMAPEARDRMAAEAGKTGGFRSAHDYSLEEFRIDRERVYAELRDIFEEYGLAK